jgi:hypothetical protein
MACLAWDLPYCHATCLARDLWGCLTRHWAATNLGWIHLPPLLVGIAPITCLLPGIHILVIPPLIPVHHSV